MKKILIGLGILVGVALATTPCYMERVDAGTYKITQKLNGELNVLDKPGWHYTGWVSNITSYKMAGVFSFSDNKEDDGQSIGVIFRDGTKGKINGNIQYMLPIDNKQRIALHTIYGRSNDQVVKNLIVKSTSEVVKATSPFFKGEGAYSYDKANFIKMVEKQLEKGLFTQVKETKIIEVVEETIDKNGNIVKIKKNPKTEIVVSALKDENGNEVISKESKFAKFNVELLGLNIEDIILDDQAMEAITKRKVIELDALVAQQNMKTAYQAAETAKAKAQEMVEVAKGKEEVEKMKAITAAEKEKEVAIKEAQAKYETAKLNRQTAEEDAKALIVKKEAEAKANAKLVQAGLTPLEKANIEKETAIGVAREIAQINVPEIVVVGGKDGNVSPLDMIGINQALEIQKKLRKE